MLVGESLSMSRETRLRGGVLGERLPQRLCTASAFDARDLQQRIVRDNVLRQTVDDGLQLRLTFAPHAELPAVFAAESNGEEALVNTHVEDDSVVVHRLLERVVLRRGREVGCVVDRSMRQRERRAASGTVDEGIDRAVRGAPR